MSNVIEKKKQVVEEITDKFKNSQSTVLVNKSNTTAGKESCLLF